MSVSARPLPSDRAQGRLNAVEGRLQRLRLDEAEALSAYRAACADLLTGRGVEAPVERAERLLARRRRDVERAEAAAAYWRALT